MHPSDPPDRPGPAEPALRDKIDFLRRPEAFAEPAGTVATVETHMSWVFLTDAHAYKMKKPVRYSFLDYSTLGRRRRMCSEELRLNRRLAPWVYLGVVPLLCDDRGRLALGALDQPAAGISVEWLVKMVRLPAERLLDRAIRLDMVAERDAERTAAHLAAFFAGAEPVAVPPPAYLRRFGTAVETQARELDAAGVPERRFAAVVRALHGFIADRQRLMLARLEGRHVIEGHGDLRPEHLFLGEPAAVIDCLEFDRALRLLDPLEELAFLAMECERLGAGKWGALFLEVYLRRTGDDAPEELMQFYKAERALLRARLAVGHLHDGEVREPRRWREQADHYLDLADRNIARL
jgi:aminoglycoside phosphotransferase family enzyme